MYVQRVKFMADRRHMAGARRLHKAQRQHLLLDDPIDELARATSADGESHLRGGDPQSQGAAEGQDAGTPHTM